MKAWIPISILALLGLWLIAFGDDERPNWDCNAEDEVVVIDDTCRHIDELHQP